MMTVSLNYQNIYDKLIDENFFSITQSVWQL